MDLGRRQATGQKVTPNRVFTGGWVAVFEPLQMPKDPYEIYHGYLTGPGGQAVMYVDDYPEDFIENGRFSAFDPNIATYVRGGQTVSFHWTTAAGTEPIVTLRLRTPEVGRL